ncbi:CheY-like chemotaxis protein [Azospirillum agricola]|uniref:response regulator transcription factor n=1 Tax=Azospirillum agricola TaxID=1720247 RepID=UPI001AE99204|nr:response regulator [Azospirillum agricola]MBP2228856.1 CheY-like chemotaxis protein [Azospirillum agricola]
MARILLVEDEIDLRDNLEIVLTHAGHEVATAANGRDALSLIERGPPDLVLSDISMPVMTGLQMLAAVRTGHPDLAEMPIVLLTALTDREDVIAGRETGADDYLTKPVDHRVLIATVEARLARSRQAVDLKQKQFVRLFKGLKRESGIDDGTGQPPPPTPLERIADIAGESLKGRVFLLSPEDIHRDHANLPASARAKIASVVGRVLAETLTDSDVMLDLGAGTRLMVLATTDRAEAADRMTLLRTRLTHALGKTQLTGRPGGAIDAAPAASGGSGGGDADDAPAGDPELSRTLKTLFASALRDGADGQPPRETFADIAATMRIDYLPLWDSRSQTVVGSRIRCRRRVDGAFVPEERTLLRGAADAMMCDLQCHLIDTAVRDQMAAAASPEIGRKAGTVIVPLALPVFQEIGAYKVERQLDDAARLLTRGQIGFLLTGIDDRVPTGLLRHIVAKLTPIGGTIATELDVNDPRLPALRPLGVNILHLDAALLHNTGLRRDRMAQAVQEAVKAASQAGFEVWASNVDGSVACRQMTAAGAVLISGKAIGGAKPEPERAQRLPATKVFLTV